MKAIACGIGVAVLLVGNYALAKSMVVDIENLKTLVTIPTGLYQYNYLIDPNTENCFFGRSEAGYHQIDCMTLRKNLPETAQYMTWISSPK